MSKKVNNKSKQNDTDKSRLAFAIEKINRSDFFNYTQVFIVIFFIYSIFRKPILGLYNTTIIAPIFSKVENNTPTIIGFICLILILFFFLAKDLKKPKLPSLKNSFILLFILLIYMYERIIYDEFQYLKILETDFVYLDVLCFIILIFLLVIWIAFVCSLTIKKKDRKHNGFIQDLPKEIKNDDKLGYFEYSRRVAEKLLNTETEKAFAIGINAKWGFGKTTFFNYLNTHIGDSDKIIKINFNPWVAGNKDDIIKEFFALFQNKVSLNSSLFNRLNKYSKRLLGEKYLIGEYLNIFKIFNQSESSFKLYDDLNKEIEKVDKKIIVFIDDVDRLKRDEVFEVLKLVRNTANFRNTFFILAYDREYVVSSIKKENKINVNGYLEKIIQFEINLPYFEKSLLIEQFKFNLKTKLNEITLKEEIEKINVNDFVLQRLINNMRDVVLLSNSVALNINKLLGEIDFHDFIKLELLRLKFPLVYRNLNINYKNYLKLEKNEYYPLTVSEFQEKEKNDFFGLIFKFEDEPSNNNESAETENKKFYIIHVSKLKKEDESIAKKTLDDIFTNNAFSLDGNKWRVNKNKKLSISNPLMTNRYFRFSLLTSELSNEDFESVTNVAYDKNKLDKFLDKLENQDKLEGLLYYLTKEKAVFEKKFDKLKIITYLTFKLGEKGFVLNKSYFDEDFFQRLIISDNVKKAGDTSKFKIFLNSLFSLDKTTQVFKAKIFHELLISRHEDYIFSLKEIKEKNTNLFCTYIDQLIKFDDESFNNVVSMYHYNNTLPGSRREIDENVKEKMKAYLESIAIEKFIEFALTIDIHRNIRLSDLISELYGDKSKLKTKVDNIINTDFDDITKNKLKDLSEILKSIINGDLKFEKIKNESFYKSLLSARMKELRLNS